jgi:threonine aldolase
MRQVGVIAAPGLIALRDGPTGMIERLADDHDNARRLAEALAEMPGVEDPQVDRQERRPFDPARVRTNLVIFRIPVGQRRAFLNALSDDGILMIPFGPEAIRAVTHYGIEADDIERTIDASRQALGIRTAVPVA